MYCHWRDFLVLAGLITAADFQIEIFKEGPPTATRHPDRDRQGPRTAAGDPWQHTPSPGSASPRTSGDKPGHEVVPARRLGLARPGAPAGIPLAIWDRRRRPHVAARHSPAAACRIRGRGTLGACA